MSCPHHKRFPVKFIWVSVNVIEYCPCTQTAGIFGQWVSATDTWHHRRSSVRLTHKSPLVAPVAPCRGQWPSLHSMGKGGDGSDHSLKYKYGCGIQTFINDVKSQNNIMSSKGRYRSQLIARMCVQCKFGVFPIFPYQLLNKVINMIMAHADIWPWPDECFV